MPLIVLEGLDGCGKSTQADRLQRRLEAAGRTLVRLREPGGTALGEQLRGILLDPATEAGPVAELFCYLAARAQLVAGPMRRHLERGDTVLLDRFWHSTIAYQAFGLGLDPAPVRAAIDLALGGLRADAALWLDLPVDECLRRRAAARGPDRIESRGRDYFVRVHAGYAALAASGDLCRVDAAGDADAIAARIATVIG